MQIQAAHVELSGLGARIWGVLLLPIPPHSGPGPLPALPHPGTSLSTHGTISHHPLSSSALPGKLFPASAGAGTRFGGSRLVCVILIPLLGIEKEKQDGLEGEIKRLLFAQAQQTLLFLLCPSSATPSPALRLEKEDGSNTKCEVEESDEIEHWFPNCVS